MRLRLFAFLLLGLLFAPTYANAASVQYLGQTPGFLPGTYYYNYGIFVGRDEPQLTFAPGNYAVLSGMSGVTAATNGYGLLFAEAFPTSVYEIANNVTLTLLSTPGTDNLFPNFTRITSTVGTVGLVNFDIHTANDYTGQVLGPVASTPEPNALALVGTAVVGVAAWSVRRRNAAGA